MPSTVVHLALAGLIAAGLLGEQFSGRTLAVVLGVVVLIDFDVFVGLVIAGAHRSVFHTLLLPLGAAVGLAYDTRVRERSRLRDQFGPGAPRVAWVSLVAFVCAGVGLDLFTGSVNLFYPLHDQFYGIDGKAVVTNRQGFVQTFVEFDHGTVQATTIGSTDTVHIDSGVDPSRGADPPDARRVFPVASEGWHLLLILTSVVVVGGRFSQSG